MMKLFVCCIIVIFNITRNVNASIETFLPSVSNTILEDSTKYFDNLSCYRPCKFNVKPRRCHYIFNVEATMTDDDKPVIAINNSVPGPPINVCLNDIILVEVRNKVPDHDLAIHWHGVEQVGTPYMDGVPMITQCPINYGSNYKYAFRASKPGTYFYHAHSVSQQSDGVFGALIVNQPSPLEPHSSLYDYDRSEENTLLFSATFPNLFTGSLEDLSQIKPTSLNINGQNTYKLFVMEGYAYRIRLINAVAVDCPLIVSVGDHDMIVIASDSSPVEAVTTKKVLLYPGERMDVVVRANQLSGRPYINISGRGICTELHTQAMFIYTAVNYTFMVKDVQNTFTSTENTAEPIIYGQTLKAIRKVPYSSNDKLIFLNIDRNVIEFRESDNDFRYISDAIPKPVFYPASLSLRDNGVVQLNGKSFLYPNVPFLTQSKDVSPQIICTVGSEINNEEPQCLHQLNALHNEIVDLVLINEGLHSNETYTFHIHGYNMEVHATWQQVNNKPFTEKIFLKMNADGKILRNTVNPPLKDTIIVPNKGYVIIRLTLDNAGAWLFECRSCGLSSLPTALIINVPLTMPKSIIDSLPKCGNYRPPDVLLT